ncbi:MAG: FtsQ-type POTRA domain-containing protein [Lactobacillales bacterium]|jgi:cell division protein FtsQ|nr:FtsQ-type POTRA domain-containing protein [Lactobacillales bacterium]
MRKLKKKRSFFSLKTKLLATFFLLLVLAGIVFFYSPAGKKVISFIQEITHAALGRSHLVLDQVLVQGHERTSIESINTALGLSQGMPIFDINLPAAREKLLGLAWVKSAVIERHLPSTLFIQITEKTPIALWQNNKTYFPLDEEGGVIPDSKASFSNLILVVGADAPENTPALIHDLKRFPEIFAKVRSAVRVGGRRWSLLFNEVEDGLVVYLPDTEMNEALSRLQELNETGHVLRKDAKIIDLRQKDRLIIRSDAEELSKLKGK